MSLRLAHSLVLASTLSLALCCILFGNILPQVFWCVLLTPWVSAYMTQKRWVWPTWAGSLVALVVFGYSGLLFVQRGVDAAMPAACAALLGIFVARLLTRQTPAHDLHSLVLSLLMVFAGTVLQQQFSYGLVLVAYTICVTWALVTRQLLHGAAMEAYRTGNWAAHAHTLSRRDVLTPLFFVSTAGVALVILLCTGVLFVAFPRVGLGGLGLGHGHGNRFPGDVSLSGPPRAGGDDTVVARVWRLGYNTFSRGLYLRGSVYDDAHIKGFSASDALLSIRPSRLALGAPEADEAHPKAAERSTYEVFLQPISDQVLLSAGYVDKAESSPGAQAMMLGVERIGYGPSGELVSMTPLTGAMRYVVEGTVTQVPPRPDAPLDADPNAVEALVFDDERFAAHFLRLPSDVDPRVQALAQRIVGDAKSFADKAKRLRSHLMNNYGYSLVQTNSERPDPLAGFLFDDKKGHCEYFATAFAVLLRAAGVPSRVVGGFQGGLWDPTGPTVIFTSAHAHAWVEWYQPNWGWVADDATPYRPATELSGMAAWMERLRRVWDDEIVDFGLDQQLAMVRGVVSALQPTQSFGGHVWSPSQLPWRKVAVLGALMAMVWAATRWRRRLGRNAGAPDVRAHPLAQNLVSALERLGQAPVRTTDSLRQIAHTLSETMSPSDADTLLTALALYERMRFAGDTVSAALERDMRKRLRRLR